MLFVPNVGFPREGHIYIYILLVWLLVAQSSMHIGWCMTTESVRTSIILSLNALGYQSD